MYNDVPPLKKNLRIKGKKAENRKKIDETKNKGI